MTEDGRWCGNVILQLGMLRCTVSAVEYMLALKSLTKKIAPAEISMAKHKEPVSWSPIKVSIDGVEMTGSYSIDNGGWMTVRMDGSGTKSAHGGPAARRRCETDAHRAVQRVASTIT